MPRFFIAGYVPADKDKGIFTFAAAVVQAAEHVVFRPKVLRNKAVVGSLAEIYSS
jgi:hypothetical protein